MAYFSSLTARVGRGWLYWYAKVKLNSVAFEFYRGDIVCRRYVQKQGDCLGKNALAEWMIFEQGRLNDLPFSEILARKGMRHFFVCPEKQQRQQMRAGFAVAQLGLSATVATKYSPERTFRRTHE